jgi:hypothetical protein
MTPGNMPRLGLQRLVAYCLNRSCRHEGADRRVEVSRRCRSAIVCYRVVCAKCGACRRIDANLSAEPHRQRVAMTWWSRYRRKSAERLSIEMKEFFDRCT